MKAPKKVRDTTDAQILQLFGKLSSNIPIVYSALRQSHPSSVYVDDPVAPKRALLHMKFRNYTCYAGKPDSEFLSAALNLIRRKTTPKLFWRDSENGWPPPRGYDDVERMRGYNTHPQSTEFYKELYENSPETLKIAPIDERLFERCAWNNIICSIYGDYESFRKAAFGFALCDEDQPLSESYAAFLGEGVAEIGLVTHEEFRKRGFAILTSAFLIAHCLRLGYRIRWSCRVDNVGSIRTAEKLGFRDPIKSRILRYPRL